MNPNVPLAQAQATDWRHASVVDPALRCDHAVQQVLQVGAFEVLVCERCGDTRHRSCTHPENVWNEAGTVLSCTTCGVDGT